MFVSFQFVAYNFIVSLVLLCMLDSCLIFQNGKTPAILVASFHGNLDVLERLLIAGVNLEKTDSVI